jgi:hypothetical protein
MSVVRATLHQSLRGHGYCNPKYMKIAPFCVTLDLEGPRGYTKSKDKNPI